MSEQNDPNLEHMGMPREGERWGLALSGGGLRATLFHLGSLLRLNELGVLSQLVTITSVSGASILAAHLAGAWGELVACGFSNQAFTRLIEDPIHAMCGQDLRTGVFLKYLDPRVAFRLLGRETSITDELARAYAEDFGLDWSLESLPSSPRFVICAANLETGKLWTFGRWPETRDSVVNDDVLMGDYIYGWERAGDVSVASAVAASSAFPIAFPPLVLETPSRDVRARYVSLTDGGVYDNLGLEPLWKFKEGATHDVILVSDAGMPMTLMDDPRSGLTTRLIRSNAVIMDQALAVRKRWLIDRFTSTKTRGAYWGIGSEHTAYGLTRSEGFLGSALSRLAAVRTDLDAFSADERFCLVNHGYAIADAGLRRWVLGGRDADMMDFRWPHPTHTNPADVIGWLEESGERGLLDDMVRAFRGRRS